MELNCTKLNEEVNYSPTPPPFEWLRHSKHRARAVKYNVSSKELSFVQGVSEDVVLSFLHR